MATVVHLAVFVIHSSPHSRQIAIALTQERGKTMVIVCVYLHVAEILLELNLLAPVATYNNAGSGVEKGNKVVVHVCIGMVFH